MVITLKGGDKKEYPYKRYQFCFETNNFKGELTDINDNRIDFEKISDTDLARFNLDRDLDTTRTNYEDLGYTCN